MQQITPLVSIVIPCYNHAQFVQETIQSVIEQDYKNIELIIIDDGSKDNSVDVIQQMIPACKERFVRFEFRHRPNKGLCATLNEAIEWCKGEFFAPLASDDIIMSHKTSVQVKYFKSAKNNSIVGFFGRASVFYDKPLNKKQLKVSAQTTSEIYDFNDVFLRKSKLSAPTAMLNLSKLKAAGGYDKKMKIEDLYMWLKLTVNGDKLSFINEEFAFYRRHPGNLSQQSQIMISGVKLVLKSYESNPHYKEALARSYFVHAGDLVENKEKGALKHLFYGLKIYPVLIVSKPMAVFLHRWLSGLKTRVIKNEN